MLGSRHRPLAANPGDGREELLFRSFAGIDVFDLDIDDATPTTRRIIASLEPTLAASTRDIKAPECSPSESICGRA